MQHTHICGTAPTYYDTHILLKQHTHTCHTHIFLKQHTHTVTHISFWNNTHLHVTHISFWNNTNIHVTHTSFWNTTHIHVTHTSVWNEIHIHVTHTSVWKETPIHLTQDMYTCDMTQSYSHATQRIHTWNAWFWYSVYTNCNSIYLLIYIYIYNMSTHKTHSHVTCLVHIQHLTQDIYRSLLQKSLIKETIFY